MLYGRNFRDVFQLMCFDDVEEFKHWLPELFGKAVAIIAIKVNGKSLSQAEAEKLIAEAKKEFEADPEQFLSVLDESPVRREQFVKMR